MDNNNDDDDVVDSDNRSKSPVQVVTSRSSRWTRIYLNLRLLVVVVTVVAVVIAMNNIRIMVQYINKKKL